MEVGDTKDSLQGRGPGVAGHEARLVNISVQEELNTASGRLFEISEPSPWHLAF